MNIILISIILVSATGLILGIIIGITARVFAVKHDPRIAEVTEMLPGVNCGGCGHAGCADFAHALVSGKASIGECPVCSPEDRHNIARYLGLEVVETEKVTAVVRCGGDKRAAVQAALYNGINDCKSAVLVAGGAKGCRYGCLGLGTCARACPFDAIKITLNGLAVVNPDICVGCGKCVISCPRSLIILSPEKFKVHVYCNSPEKVAIKKKFCSAACIACRKCVKAAEEGQMLVEGFLVRTNYKNPNPPSIELVKKAECPTDCLRTASYNLERTDSAIIREEAA